MAWYFNNVVTSDETTITKQGDTRNIEMLLAANNSNEHIDRDRSREIERAVTNGRQRKRKEELSRPASQRDQPHITIDGSQRQAINISLLASRRCFCIALNVTDTLVNCKIFHIPWRTTSYSPALVLSLWLFVWHLCVAWTGLQFSFETQTRIQLVLCLRSALSFARKTDCVACALVCMRHVEAMKITPLPQQAGAD